MEVLFGRAVQSGVQLDCDECEQRADGDIDDRE
jgi:hypothetical protein